MIFDLSISEPLSNKKDEDVSQIGSTINVMDSQATKTDFDFTPNVLPLSERILPDKWLNIPPVLVKAFHVDIENQESLEQMIINLNKRIDRFDTQMKIDFNDHKKKTLAAVNDMKRENKKELNVVDNKLIKMIGDIRKEVADANEEKE